MARFQVHDIHRVNNTKRAAQRKGRQTPPPWSRIYAPRDTTGLIHRPPSGGACITKTLGVDKHSPFLKRLREFAARYLDFDLLVSEQPDPAQWERFCKDVAVEFPVLAKYRNVWIVRDYVSHHLHVRVKKQQRRRDSGMRKSNGNASSSAREVVQVNSVEPSAHSEVSENAEPAHVVKANRERKKRPVIQNLAYVEIIQKTPVRVLSASRDVNQASSSASIPLVPEDSSEPVKRFLGSLVPDLSYLWPVFDKLGINSEASLDGVKSWPSESRDAILMDFVGEGKITRIQGETIRMGFNGDFDIGTHL